MNESMDDLLADWLHEGPETGPRAGLERTLAATRRVGQRPWWTLPERWLPMQPNMARTRSQRRIVALAIVALLAVALVATALVIGSLRRQTPSLYRNGAVVYERDGDLFIADRLGGTARPLVAGPEEDRDPVFSPEGDRVAFVRDGIRIMAVAPDGADVTELATVDAGVKRRGLDWSPDGSALLASYLTSGEQWYQTEVIASDGSGSRRLAVGSHVVGATWRPNGRQVLFCGLLHGDDSTRGVYIADPDGTDVRALPGSEFSLGCPPEWSPDGRHVAFENSDGPHAGGIDIADIAEDGAITDVRPLDLGPNGTLEVGPAWSPDGSQLAFVLKKGDHELVGVVNPDGSGYRAIVPDGSRIWGPSLTWSPDGRSLVIAAEFDDQNAWSVDVASGEQALVQTPAQTWQRLAP
jgi:Tol biopolymer transport system component